MTPPRKHTAFGGPAQPSHPLCDLHLTPRDYERPVPAPRPAPPDLWPDGLVIAVDTREQAPYSWPGRCVRATLATGDYAILGAEAAGAVERKSLPDLLGSVGAGRERFEREWERLAAMKAPALVVEADLRGILAGTDHSQMHPRAVIGTLVSWSARWRVPVWFAGDRRHGEALTALWLRMVWRHHLTDEERAAATQLGRNALGAAP